MFCFLVVVIRVFILRVCLNLEIVVWSEFIRFLKDLNVNGKEKWGWLKLCVKIVNLIIVVKSRN